MSDLYALRAPMSAVEQWLAPDEFADALQTLPSSQRMNSTTPPTLAAELIWTMRRPGGGSIASGNGGLDDLRAEARRTYRCPRHRLPLAWRGGPDLPYSGLGQ